MLNAQLVSLSRQMALRRELDVVANNLANINTGGFKAQSLLFEEYLMPVADATAFEGSDRKLFYVNDWATFRDLAQGRIVPTDGPLDVAIEGDGYFVVQTPAGERYTRNGAFKISSAGELVNNEGHRVLGDGGAINFSPTDTDIAIASDGTISTPEGQIGTLRIVTFDNEQELVRESSTLYRGSDPKELDTPRLAQGTLEKSNVNPVVELSRMIEITRNYELQAKIVADAEKSRKDAIETLGTLQA